jgi:hypothetical protein
MCHLTPAEKNSKCSKTSGTGSKWDFKIALPTKSQLSWNFSQFFFFLIIFLATYFIENSFKVGKTFDKMA